MSVLHPTPVSIEPVVGTPPSPVELDRTPPDLHLLRVRWPGLAVPARVEMLRALERQPADTFFCALPPAEQGAVLVGLGQDERRAWMRLLPPDDLADVLQSLDEAGRSALLHALDAATRREVNALLAYAEDDAGGLMNPRFARLRPEMTVGESVRYLQEQASSQDRIETIYSAYVLDQRQRLLGVVSFRDLFRARPDAALSGVMETRVVSVRDDLDQEAVARIIAQHDLHAVPVVDADGCMKGIVTVDDIVDVVQNEATEDIQKLGGMEAFDSPYLRTSLLEVIRKRAGWLVVLFMGEMLTTWAMASYEADIARAVVLALFVPLIISSGGNVGSQASTLIIRAMALGEVGPGDWWRIIRREFATGLVLGTVLASLGALRIGFGQLTTSAYGPEWVGVMATVGVSLVGVVTWGTLVGSTLPFVIRRFGFDPASASAPFVATLVDVTGLVIYFTVGKLFLLS
jgi:magnesium transporter